MALVAWGLLVGGLPLLSGAPGGDDAYYHAMYAQQHARCWRGGVLFPRWYPDLNGGLGSPEPRPRPLLPLVLHAAFALGLDDAVSAISLATLLIPPVAGLVMLAAARRRGAPLKAAAVAGLVWTVAPYLMVSLHERAALQEAWACALLPWVFVTLLPPRPGSAREAVASGCAFALLLATQLLFAFMAGLVIVAAHVVSRTRQPRRAGAAVGLGLGLAAVSWVPNVVSLGRVQGERFASGWFDWRGRFLFLGGDPDPVLARHMLAVFLAASAAALLIIVTRQAEAGSLALGGLAVLMLATPLAYWIYAYVPGFALLQFPWRWLAPASCLVTLALAAVRLRWVRLVGAALFVLPILIPFAWRWRLPPGPALRPSDPPSRAAQAATRFGVPPILPSFPATLPHGVDLAAALRRATEARATLPTPEPAGPRLWVWRLDGKTPAPAVVPLLADDGWAAEIDGEPAPWRPRDGLVEVVVPVGPHTLRLAQEPLPEDLVGIAVTAATALGLGLWFLRRKVPGGESA
ncbi:MAG TPA: hypothetical protein VMT45_06840 [Thermoanaerobaculaceae bacterium]|nr:hypothetical protein [Thermoanaerobaculaceae bacterium]